MKKKTIEKPIQVDAEKEQQTAGLRCPKCGCGHLPVTDTRPLPGGRVRRYRTCRYCGRSIRTTEKIDAEEWNRMMKLTGKDFKKQE